MSEEAKVFLLMRAAYYSLMDRQGWFPWLSFEDCQQYENAVRRQASKLIGAGC